MLTDCRFQVSVTKWTEFTFQVVGFFLKFVTKTRYIILIKTNQNFFLKSIPSGRAPYPAENEAPALWFGHYCAVLGTCLWLLAPLVDEHSPQRLRHSACEKKVAPRLWGARSLGATCLEVALARVELGSPQPPTSVSAAVKWRLT